MRALSFLPEIGILCVRALLNILVVDAVQFFEVGKSINSKQLVKTVELIAEDYMHFKPEDFKLCFSRAMKGYYGKIYDRVDGAVILEWLMKFDNERDSEIESLRAKQNRELKKIPLPIIAEPENPDYIFKSNMLKLHKALEDNKKERDAAKVQKAQVKDENKNQIYLMHMRWLEQYRAVWKRQKYPRLIRRYGKCVNPFYGPFRTDVPKTIYRQLDKNEFLEHKQWQYELSRQPKDIRTKMYLKKYQGE